MDLETLAFEGISIDFQFKSDKPTFGDLFLIVGHEHPAFPPNSREFEKLNKLGFDQVDDYFGIKNGMDKGDDVALWLYPIINGEEVHNSNGPFDAVRISYLVVRNDVKNIALFEKTYQQILSSLPVTPIFNGKPITKFSELTTVIDKTVDYCRKKLKVEPGSDKAMELEW